jgi:two-component system chemotaxis response regulator CheB
VPPTRVLIVDDSAVIRRQLSEALAADSEIVVIGTAGSGPLALARILESKPDVVTLDVEMRGMDGLATLSEIRKVHPKLPVIMFSALTGAGAAATVEALARGASDYATKPTQAGSPDSAREQIRQELIPKIKALAAGLCRYRPNLTIPVVPARDRGASRIDIVAIGSSTGGPNALAELVPRFPADFPVPIVMVQHMPPMFTQLLAERLNSLSKLRVGEAADGQRLQPGRVWIAPGDYHMFVCGQGGARMIGLNQNPQENSCRPAVDVLFRSVARCFGANVLAVVLTGMGSDGTRGAASIREAGGTVIAQDEATSVVWGMPGSIISAGLADRVCPLGSLGPEILRRVWWGRTAAAVSRS